MTQDQQATIHHDFCYECDKTTRWDGEFCTGCGREWGYGL